MITVSGQLTVVVTEKDSGIEERVTIDACELDIECEQTDVDDDKRRVSAYLKHRGTAFEGDSDFTLTAFYDVFGWNVFQRWKTITSDTVGYKAALATDEPDDGFIVEATPIDLNQPQ